MYHPVRKIRLIYLIFMLLFVYSRADAFQIKIIPRSDLIAGRITDGTELAFVHISGISEGCELHVWESMARNEYTPGHYTLPDKDNHRDMIDIMLSGDDWQPNTDTGKGVKLIKPQANSILRIKASGDQLLGGSTWVMSLTAQCSAQHPLRKTEPKRNR